MAPIALHVAFALAINIVTIVAEEPFQIIWHATTEGNKGCSKEFGVDIDYASYGLIQNTAPGSNGWMKGEVITIIYMDKIWPHLTSDSDDSADDFVDYGFVYGGIPQNGDLPADLGRLADLIKERIPDKDFAGLAVLDFEKWRPLYDWNFKNGIMERYQKMSRKKVEDDRKDDNLSAEDIKEIAEQEFDEAARSYFEGALIMAKGMRPNAKWGYYIYPLCNGAEIEKACKDNTYDFIERLTWLVDASGALFPSAYFKDHMDLEKQRPFMYGPNSVALEWVKMSNDTFKPIYTYNGIVKSMSNADKSNFEYYEREELVNGIGLCADMGMNGVAIWGNGDLRDSAAICQDVKEWVDETLGPYVERVLEFTKKCSEDLCSSKGRCFKVDIERDSDKVDYSAESSYVYDEDKVKEEYKCRCYEGWKGENCDQEV